jgi:hypothetical protein
MGAVARNGPLKTRLQSVIYGLIRWHTCHWCSSRVLCDGRSPWMAWCRPNGSTDEELLTTVHSAKLTIRHKSVGTRWGGCVIRTHDLTLGIDRSQNHAHFNPDIRSCGDACRV